MDDPQRYQSALHFLRRIHEIQIHEAKFEVRAERRRRVTIDPDLYARIETWAHQRGIVPETLVNLWLAERLKLQELT